MYCNRKQIVIVKLFQINTCYLSIEDKTTFYKKQDLLRSELMFTSGLLLSVVCFTMTHIFKFIVIDDFYKACKLF